MSKFDKLLDTVEFAEEEFENARREMYDYIAPIIKGHTGVTSLPEVFSHAFVNCEFAYITLRQSHQCDGETYGIPRAASNKADADAAAAYEAARLAREQRRREAQRARDEEKFEALRLKLGK